MLDREAPGFEVRVGRPVDVELLGPVRLIIAPLPFHPVTDRRRHSGRRRGETLVAFANPFTQEGVQQSVALGGAGVESAHVRSGLSHTTPGYPC